VSLDQVKSHVHVKQFYTELLVLQFAVALRRSVRTCTGSNFRMPILIFFVLCINRRSLYSQVFDLKKPLIKTSEGVYIEEEPENDLCWKKCLSALYHAHHVHPAIVKQSKLNPGQCTGRKINVSLDQYLKYIIIIAQLTQ